MNAFGSKPIPTLKLTFEWDGKTVNKETSGFDGKTCTESTDFIEKALGAHDKNITFKPEYHKKSPDSGNRIHA
jgi:hypothetical protein